MNKNDSSLSQYKLPTPIEVTLNLMSNWLIQKELSYNLFDLQQENLKLLLSLSDEQQIYHSVKKSIDENKGEMYFIYDHGGTRKTFLWNTLISVVRSIRKIELTGSLESQIK